jgi:peptidoglycan/xylan/chitin deacetylase (PgdA/CDA1 family)
MYISDFPKINVTGFAAWDHQPGEKDDFSGIYKELIKDNIDWEKVDEVLISSHEYQREIDEWLNGNIPKEKKINKIYDDACDSLMYVMPSKWPIMNEFLSRQYGLNKIEKVEITASNIDFDFEPNSIQINERYAIVINYHYLRSHNDDALKITNYVSPENFSEQLRQLKENFTFCRCTDLVDEKIVLGESNVLITFDDGSKDIITSAQAILDRYDVPATFFICSAPYTDNRVLDVHKIQIIMERLGFEKFSKQFYELLTLKLPKGVKHDSLEYANNYQLYRYDKEEIRDFKLDLNYRVPYIYSEEIIDLIFKKLFSNESEKEIIKQIYLSIDDLKSLKEKGHELAVHGHSHRLLPRMSFEQQKADLESSSNFLNSITGETSFTVAYPYGLSDIHTKRAMKDLNMKAGFGLGREMLTPEHIKDRWDLPRYDVNDCFDKQTNDMRYKIFSNLSTGD